MFFILDLQLDLLLYTTDLLGFLGLLHEETEEITIRQTSFRKLR